LGLDNPEGGLTAPAGRIGWRVDDAGASKLEKVACAELGLSGAFC
jgi:hypothetical protein